MLQPKACPLCKKTPDIGRGDFEHTCKNVTISSKEMGAKKEELIKTWNKYVDAIAGIRAARKGASKSKKK